MESFEKVYSSPTAQALYESRLAAGRAKYSAMHVAQSGIAPPGSPKPAQDTQAATGRIAVSRQEREM